MTLIQKLFGKRKRRSMMNAERAIWPLATFKSPKGNQPQAWNNRFGKQNSWTKQFSKLWSLSLRSLW